MISKLATYEHVASIDDGPRPHLNKAAVLHTAVSGATDLHDFWASGAAGSGVGAHFYINESGHIYQYLDTDRKTGHAWAANEFAVGIETWDGGNSTIPWNAAQVASIVALLKELGVPAQALKETTSDGVGYHREYPSWNLSSHTCPGDARAAQVTSTIIPALKSSGGGLIHTMASDADISSFFDTLFDKADTTVGSKKPTTAAGEIARDLLFLRGQRLRRSGAARPEGGDEVASVQQGWDHEDGAALPAVKK